MADAGVVYIVLLETAKGFLVLGSFPTFVVVVLLFVFMEGDQ